MPIFLFSRSPLQDAYPEVIKHQSKGPYTYKNDGLDRSKDSTSNDNKTADDSEQYRHKDKRLYRPRQLWLPVSKNDGAEHG